MFAPALITAPFGRTIVARVENDGAPTIGSVRSAIWEVDRNFVVTETGTVADILKQYSYAEPRFSVAVFSAFAVVGLVLVTLGVYGVIAYAVARQTLAIGVRIALGVSPQQVQGMVLNNVPDARAGGALGIVAALAGTHVLTTQLWGVTPTTRRRLGLVLALIVVVGFAAGYVLPGAPPASTRWWPCGPSEAGRTGVRPRRTETPTNRDVLVQSLIWYEGG